MIQVGLTSMQKKKKKKSKPYKFKRIKQNLKKLKILPRIKLALKNK